MGKALRKRIAELALPGLQWEVPLSGLCTIRVGGTALAVVRPRSKKEAIRVFDFLAREDIPWRAMGRGSNILAADQGYHGVLVVLGREMAEMEMLDKGGCQIRVEAGCSLARLLHLAVKKGLAGLEFAAGIPGTVGGAVVMNAGSTGGCTADILTEVEWLGPEGDLHRERPEEIGFTYRSWQGAAGAVVLSASFRLAAGESELIRGKISERLRSRGRSQPVGAPSFGSVFKNPPGDYAGRLIEAAGLKGTVRGEAMISEKHANFIVNRGKAMAADVIALMRLARARVADLVGVLLEPEVHILTDQDNPLWDGAER